MSKLSKLLANNFPELKEEFDSKQFELSEKIIEKRLFLNLSLEEVAKLNNITASEYIGYEYGNIDLPLESYFEILDTLDSYKI